MANYSEVIPPGQAGEITLEVDGKKVHDTFSKTATVTTNDPKLPQFTLSVGGTIVPYVELRPSDRVYLRGMYGETVEKEIILFSNETDKPLEIRGMTSNIDDKITYKLVSLDEPGHYKVKIWKNPKLPTLNTWGSLFIYTNSENSPEKTVQVNVTTRGAIVCQPMTLNFGTVPKPGASPVERSLTIYKLKGDFQIRDVEFSVSNYKADVTVVEEGKKYTVTVKLNPGAKSSYMDEMIINTDDPLEPSVKIRLLARSV